MEELTRYTGKHLDALVDDALVQDSGAADWGMMAHELQPSQKPQEGDPFGRMFGSSFGDRALKVIGNESETLSQIGVFAANALGFSLSRNAADHGSQSRIIVVYHGTDRLRRSLLILDPTLNPSTPPQVLASQAWGDILRRDIQNLREMRSHIALPQHLPDDALEALLIARPRVIRAPAPPLEYTCVARPPGQVQSGANPSTAGAYARDASGASGVTVCHHGTGSAGTPITIDGMRRTVTAASPLIDTCFVQIPDWDMPPAGSMIGRKGLLTSRAPGARERHKFWSAGTELDAAMVGTDLGVPYHTPRRQLCVYTDAVTNYGDSGGALVNDYDELVGFAFQRTPFGVPIQYATWIWARSAFAELNLTTY